MYPSFFTDICCGVQHPESTYPPNMSTPHVAGSMLHSVLHCLPKTMHRTDVFLLLRLCWNSTKRYIITSQMTVTWNAPRMVRMVRWSGPTKSQPPDNNHKTPENIRRARAWFFIAATPKHHKWTTWVCERDRKGEIFRKEKQKWGLSEYAMA